jgi:phage N-6-adenine-methyltransferase
LSALLEANRAVRGRATPQRPGRSKQDFGTPPEFLAAVVKRFGVLEVDLACSATNAVAPAGYTEKDDSLAQDWTMPGVKVAWLNPPFGDIRPWAAKCESVRHLPRWTLMLIPASMGSLWWRDHVLNKCQIDGIPRLQFVGADSIYPKDLALLAYGYSVTGSGFWDWRE